MGNIVKNGKRGLRVRQKEQRKQQILVAAGNLFTKVGFDETTMEDIADKAVVSVPTVYSYFASKSDLLFELFETDERLIEPHVRAILDDLPAEPIAAIVNVELAIIMDGYDTMQKRVWREISAAALRSAKARRSQFIELQNSRVAWLREVFDTLKIRGQVRPDLCSYSAARIIYAIGRNGFRMYIMNDATTLKDLETQIREDVSIAFSGMTASL